MSTMWVEKGRVWYLECTDCPDAISCVHTVDMMMSAGAPDLIIPTGTVVLPMAGEFPDFDKPAIDGAMTSERLGSYRVKISETINSYGTRKVSIATLGEPVFLMTINPEDSVVSIYDATDKFVNTQVFYTGGDKFGNCRAPNHSMQRQMELDKLAKVSSSYPMLKFWDLLSKLTTSSCVVCMWKRNEPVTVPDANASGLGSL